MLIFPESIKRGSSQSRLSESARYRQRHEKKAIMLRIIPPVIPPSNEVFLFCAKVDASVSTGAEESIL